MIELSAGLQVGAWFASRTLDADVHAKEKGDWMKRRIAGMRHVPAKPSAWHPSKGKYLAAQRVVARLRTRKLMILDAT